MRAENFTIFFTVSLIYKSQPGVGLVPAKYFLSGGQRLLLLSFTTWYTYVYEFTDFETLIL